MNVVVGTVLFVLALAIIIVGSVVVIGWISGDIDFDDLPTRKNKDQKEWKMFHCHKPNQAGWYLCTVEQGSRYPMLLYWDYSGGTGKGRFIDPVRKSVFDTYEVMVTKKFEEGMKTDNIMPDEEYMERIFTDDACDRTDYVIAWKPEPRVFMGEVKNSRNIGKDRASFGAAGARAGFAVDEHFGLSSDEIINTLTKGLESRTRGKCYDLSLEEVDEIVSKYVSRGANGVCTADELRSALIKAETINIHSNGRE